MSSMDKVAKELYSAISKKDERTPKPYDTEATVVREEGDTIWVKIPGGIDETPVRKTINAKPGDNVQVRVADGRAWVMGNSTNPPTDDSTANYAVDLSTNIKKDVTVLNTVVTENIEATNARFGNVEADTAKIHDLTADQLTASVGYIEDLTADNITANDISADHATIDDLDVNYAQINAANVTDLSAQNAWVNKIMVQTGLLAHEGTVFTLDAIQVNAANITAGTIDVNRLIVTVDGEKYLVEIDPTTHQPSYEKLDGGIVEPRTITADKIVAHDITVQEITTENLVGTNGWINLNAGTFFYTTNGSTWANTTNGIMWDGTSLKIKGDVNVTSGNIYTKTEIDQTVSGINTTVSSKADASNVYTKSEIDQTVSGINASVSAKADGATTTAALALKANKDTLTSEINASADTVQINANRVNIAGVITAINDNTTTTINGNKITTGTLQASSIYIGSDVLTNVLNDITDELGNVYQLNILTSYTSAGVVHTAQLLQNGVDIASQIPNDFEWLAKLTTGYEFIGNGRSITIAQSNLHYAHAVTVSWTRRQDAYLVNNVVNNLVTSTGAKLVGRAEY